MSFNIKNYKLEIIMLLIIIIPLLILGLAAIKNKKDFQVHGTNEISKINGEDLKPLELREYGGIKLDSVYDFRENSIKGPQYIDINDYTLKITGMVEEEKEYTYEEIINRSTRKKVAKLTCVEGWSVNLLWEGIVLRDLLKEANPNPEANKIIFHAYDGYTTNHHTEYIMDYDILMAHKMNNITLMPERGFPFQLVAEGEWGYKWVKWITEIEFTDDPDYRGYWEARGYSDTGKLGESFLD